MSSHLDRRRGFVKSQAGLPGLALGLGAGVTGCTTRGAMPHVHGERLPEPVPHSDGVDPPSYITSKVGAPNPTRLDWAN